MNINRAQNYEYHLGGSLPVDAPSYVKRKADDDLYQALIAGRYCYALNSRQMGKSSLRVRTWHKLQDQGVKCATIDISGINSEGIEPNDWYFGMAYRLGTDLNLFVDFNELVQWWRNREPLPPAQRLADYIDLVVLESIRQDVQQRVVVFVDEIDSLFKLEFGDDFFDLVRNCHGKRAIREEYRRLTFALMGVADPADLVKDKHRPPFNIGEAITLSGFEFEEASQSLIAGLTHKSIEPKKLLLAILSWTGGQPFLTQKICDLAAREASSPEAGREGMWVGELIQKRIVDNWEVQDAPIHFRAIRDRILQNNNLRTARMLGLYQDILREEEVEADSSLDQMELRLAGLVVVQNQKVKVSNLIYRAIFDEVWAEKRLAELRPYGEMLAAWLKSDRQDESRLLRGQALRAAREWAVGKKLSDDDYEFLAASEKLEKDAIQQALNVEEEEKKILFVAKQKADRRVRIGGVIFALTLVAAGIAAATGVTKAGRAQSELSMARSEVTARREELQKVKADSQEVESALSSTTIKLERAQSDLIEIQPQLLDKQKALKESESALHKLQGTLISTQSKLKETKHQLDIQNAVLADVRTTLEEADAKYLASSERLKEIEISLENKPFETYLAELQKPRSNFEDYYEGTTKVYAKSVIEILKAKGPQYEKRVAALQAQIKDRSDSRNRNRIFQIVLYKGTGNTSWKKKIFDSFREEAKEIAQQSEGVSFNSLNEFVSLVDWDNDDDRRETLITATDFILNYGLADSAKEDLFTVLWRVQRRGISDADSFRQFDLRQFVALVKTARNIMRKQNDDRYSGARTFLFWTAPQAYLIYSGQLFVMPGLLPELRTDILSDVQYLKRQSLKNSNCPTYDDPREWQSWLTSNSQTVALWNEPDLTTLMQNLALLESQMKLWR